MFAMQALSPLVSKLQRAFAQSVLSTQYRSIIDLGALLRADTPRSAGHRGSVTSGRILLPSEVRTEEGWPASSDSTADSIKLPAMGGAKPGEGDEPKPAPTSDDDGEKTAHLDQHRAV